MGEKPTAFCPYVGLRPFHEEDKPYFFGREREVRAVVDNLFGARVTIFYGASGTGKSSVLMAGVLPELRKEPRTAVVLFRSWQVADAPRALKRELIAAAGQLATGDLALDENLPLDELLKRAAERIDGTVLLILDQFEEFFLYFKDPESGFDAELGRAISRRDIDAGFLISLREDSLSKLDRFKRRVPTLLTNTLRLSHLDADAARLATERPLEEYNKRRPEAAGNPVTIEPALVKAVLEQTIPGRLSITANSGGTKVSEELEAGRVEAPFLQLVLERLWTEEIDSGSRALRLATLDRLGGAKTIVRSHVDQVLKGLDPRDQELCARLFDRLVTPSGAKIACRLKDLCGWGEELGAEVPRLTKFFDQNRILVRIPAPPGSSEDEDQYQLLHDVLAAGVLDWRSRYVDVRKLAAANAEAERQRKEAERERERADAARRAALRARIFGAVASVAFLLACLFAYQATKATSRAEQAAREALAGQLAVDSSLLLANDPDRAQLLAVESFATAPMMPVTGAALRIAFDAFPDLAATLRGESFVDGAFSADGKLIVAVSIDGTARLWDRVGNEVKTLSAPSDRVVQVAFSRDGNRLVAVGQEGTAQLLDTGHTTPTALKDNDGSTTFATLSPDGTRVVTGGQDGTVRLWDAAGNRLKELKGDGKAVSYAAFSPDGKTVVIAIKDAPLYNAPLRLWDTARAEAKRLEQRTGEVTFVTFSPDGKMFLTTSADKTARLWDASGRLLRVLKGHDGVVLHGAFSPDGTRIVTASRDRTARLWDAAGTEIKKLAGHSGNVVRVAFSPNGEHIVTAGADSTARVWDASGNLLKELKGHTLGVVAAAFSPDGSLIMTVGGDSTTRLWRVADTPPTVLEGHTDLVRYATFSPDGKLIVTTSNDNTARLWDAGSNRLIKALRHDSSVTHAAFSPDGKRIVTTSVDTTARLWDSAGNELQQLRGHEGTVAHAAFSPAGDRIVTASWDRTARLWDSSGTLVKKLEGHGDNVNQVAFSPDGRLIVTASHDRTARLWDASGNPLAELKGHKDAVVHAAFSPDGKRVLTASWDRTARLWDTAGKPLMALVGHKKDLNDAAFSPAGNLIVTASDDGTARIWDAASGKPLKELRGHRDWVYRAKFSRDGTLIVTASADGTARLWDASGYALKELKGHTFEIIHTAFSPDGKLVVTASRDRTARVWRHALAESPDVMVARIKGRVGRELTDDERQLSSLPARAAQENPKPQIGNAAAH